MIVLYSRIKIIKKKSYHFKLPKQMWSLAKQKFLHYFNKFLVLDVCPRLLKTEDDVNTGSRYIFSFITTVQHLRANLDNK